jgi:hypothetical protein
MSGRLLLEGSDIMIDAPALTPAVVSANALTESTRQAHVYLAEAGSHLSNAVESAIAAGEELQRAKSALKAQKGQKWIQYLESSFPAYGIRTLQNYMRLAREARLPEKRNALRKMSLRAALRCLSEGHKRTGGDYSDEWFSPQSLIDLCLATLGKINLDPCWHEQCIIRADRVYTKADNGLTKPWLGRVYLNPPFQENPRWIQKLRDEFTRGNVTEAIVAVPNRTDAEWFSWLDEYPRCHLRGRVKFFRPGDDPNNHKWSPPFPCAAIYLGKRTAKFAEVFATAGAVFARSKAFRVPAAPMAEVA